MTGSSANRPIGIFDSGVGGLTVFAEIRKRLPCESLIYFGDTARLPYGNKSAETVIRYSLENASFLADRGVKAIVVACNTASALALPALSSKFDLPVIGVVAPGARAAIKATKNRKIGVIGTQATISSGAYGRALREMDSEVKVVSQACPLFVPLVEEGWIDNEVARAAARRYLSGIKEEGIDVLILGCTHYPLLKPLIREVVGSGIELVDSAEAAADSLGSMLEKNDLERKSGESRHQIYVTDLPARFESIARRFLGDDAPQIRHVTA
jgi:glutamate racemase